ncbi:tetraspanin family protein (macronuclear) [Tetrahymena thermophila SB210]|uniref:Tetraspanin family protein n=1 Tax=Tetrahymena thermophila (strain SB210) TaxID=312017 RepID=W7X2L0_TETTS|nr:tetraspanin family protein [Tetrahymena thermophila SB210]EWS73490.1 tetraspanin family protein [Tetrahymena thermophila SB210]|eukprot:XP_012653972.1 tetraspanin family protein [Tetrahymena thermophila SB210]
MKIKISPSFSKAFISICSFLIIIQGMISLYLGANFLVLVNADNSWLYEFFDVTSLKVNLMIYGILLILLGVFGMIGIFQKKNIMVFTYNIGTMLMFIYSISLLVSMVTYKSNQLPSCQNNQSILKYETYSKFIQSFGLCTDKCPCLIDTSIQKLYNPSIIQNLRISNVGKQYAVDCAQSEQDIKNIKSSQEYIELQRLENFFNCQGMCTLYDIEVYQFTGTDRGVPYNQTCYSQLETELNFFYLKSISALSTQLFQLIVSLVLAFLQYKSYPQYHKDKRIGFYGRLSQF